MIYVLKAIKIIELLIQYNYFSILIFSFIMYCGLCFVSSYILPIYSDIIQIDNNCTPAKNVIATIIDVEMVDGARDYRLMSRKEVDSIISMREYNRYSKGLFTFVGFKTKWISYENIERVAGKTKWSFWKLFKYALEGITAFSTAPLIFSSIIGLLFCLVAFLLIILIIVRTLVFGDPTSGWPSMVCIIFFVSGVQLFSLGIIGQYMSKSYLEIKHRPIYIIRETEKDEE